MTQDQHRIIYLALDAEVTKARRAATKARKAYQNAPYGDESMKAAVMLDLRLAQYEAAVKMASEYFDSYITQ